VGPKKYNGLELDEGTGGRSLSGRNDSVVREGQRTRPGEKASERKVFFWKAHVTAEAVTYKAKAESKSAGKSACATEARIGARRVSLRLC
jgi:hypothetical protein